MSLQISDPSLAFTLMSVVTGVAGTYAGFAPSLKELRAKEKGDDGGRQQLLDADLITGALVLIAGTFASFAAGNVLPLVVMVAIYIATSFWFHAVLNSEAFS